MTNFRVRRHSSFRSVHSAVYVLAVWMILARGSNLNAQQSPGSAGRERASLLLAHARELTGRGDYNGAAKAYEQALRLTPDSVVALNNLGVLYAHMGKYPEAAGAYERALRLKPDSFPFLVNLGLAYFKGGNFKAAIKPFSRAVRTEPTNFQARTLLAMS